MTVQIGLALSGGGAKGLAHVGVLKVLEETHIPVHMVTGTSMGGVVAAAYAAGHSASELEQYASSLRLLDIAQLDPTGEGLLGQNKIADLMREVLGGDLTFDQLQLPLGLVAVDLDTGEEVVIREGSVVKGVLATTALPIVFSPVDWEGRRLIDGGAANPVPFDVVRNMGADRVIAVHTLYDPSSEPAADASSDERVPEAIIRLLLYRTRWASLINVAERSLGIMSRKLTELRMQQAPPDLMIRVLVKQVRLFDLDKTDVCLQAGDQAAREHLSELIALRNEPLPSH